MIYLLTRQHGIPYEGTETEVLGYRTTEIDARERIEAMAHEKLGSDYDVSLVVFSVESDGQRFFDALSCELVSKRVDPKRVWRYWWNSGTKCDVPDFEDDWPVLSDMDRTIYRLLADKMVEDSKRLSTFFSDARFEKFSLVKPDED